MDEIIPPWLFYHLKSYNIITTYIRKGSSALRCLLNNHEDWKFGTEHPNNRLNILAVTYTNSECGERTGKSPRISGFYTRRDKSPSFREILLKAKMRERDGKRHLTFLCSTDSEVYVLTSDDNCTCTHTNTYTHKKILMNPQNKNRRKE